MRNLFPIRIEPNYIKWKQNMITRAGIWIKSHVNAILIKMQIWSIYMLRMRRSSGWDIDSYWFSRSNVYRASVTHVWLLSLYCPLSIFFANCLSSSIIFRFSIPSKVLRPSIGGHMTRIFNNSCVTLQLSNIEYVWHNFMCLCIKE